MIWLFDDTKAVKKYIEFLHFGITVDIMSTTTGFLYTWLIFYQ